MFVGQSKNCKTIQIPTEIKLNCIDLGNPKFNWEQLNVTILKREKLKTIWKSLALQNHVKRMVLEL